MHNNLLLFFSTALIGLAGLAVGADSSATCQTYGPIFGVDPLGSVLLLKDADGYLKDVKLPPGTSVSKLPVSPDGHIVKVSPADLNVGDLACVHTERPGTAPQISVVTRADLHRVQADFLVRWQRESLYGNIKSIDISARTLVIAPLPPWSSDTPIRVSLPAQVRLRTASPDARRITDSTSFSLEDLRVGEPVYVRGTRAADSSEMAASVVVKGGYRGILGALIEVQVLASTLRVREFGTGDTLTIKMTPGETYRTTENLTNPMRVETASGVVLAPVGLADLQAGDAILILGKLTGAKEGEGIVALTKFGTFGVAPQDPEQHVTWLLAK